jgi:coenzyme Q-binding protein COQ10
VRISKRSQPLPYPAEQLFDLAAGIEDYPRFLRGWIEARIIGRSAGACQVEQVLGFGPLHLRFRSRATFFRPERIEVTSDDPPFRLFRLVWHIGTAAEGGCRAGIEADVQMRSRLGQQLVDPALPAVLEDFMTAFETRARQLHGPR